MIVLYASGGGGNLDNDELSIREESINCRAIYTIGVFSVYAHENSVVNIISLQSLIQAHSRISTCTPFSYMQMLCFIAGS